MVLIESSTNTVSLVPSDSIDPTPRIPWILVDPEKSSAGGERVDQEE